MTTITLNSDATSMIVNNPFYTSGLTQLSLTVDKGCASTPTTFNLASKISTITSNQFTINVADLYPTKDRFDDGVYSFEIRAEKVNVVAGFDVCTTKNCVFVDYNIKCKLDTNKKIRLYKAMMFAHDCDTCTCTEMCKMYAQLTQTSIPDVTDCGCS